MSTPARMPHNKPSQGLPVSREPTKPAIAPISMVPSMPMFKMPERSANVSPRPASKRGIAMRTHDDSRASRKLADRSCCHDCSIEPHLERRHISWRSNINTMISPSMM